MGHPWIVLHEGYHRNMSQGSIVTKDQWTVASLGRPRAPCSRASSSGRENWGHFDRLRRQQLPGVDVKWTFL